MSRGVLDEERLLVERARRDPEAFSDVYTLYYDRIYGYVYSRVQNRETAEDITADSFMLALEHLGKYEWRNVPFGAWLFRIAANQVVGHYRRLRTFQHLDESLAYDQAGPEEEVLRLYAAEEVRQAVGSLKVDQQRAMDLRYRHDMRAREIASQMGRTEAAVKLLLHRALHTLRARMLPLSA